MLPENRISSEPVNGNYLLGLRTSKLKTTAFGGDDLNMTSGDFKNIWSGEAIDGNIVLTFGDKTHQVVSGKNGITFMDFCFTRSMSYVVAWVDSTGVYYKHYNDITGDYSEVKINGAISVCCSLDDTRKEFSSTSDVIISYQKSINGELITRLQRERYGVDHILSENTEGKLFQTGMMDTNRFGWSFFEESLEVPDFVCDIQNGFMNYHTISRGRYSNVMDTPEFDAIVQTIVEHKMKRQCEYLNIKDKILDIDKSTGICLDQIGTLIGQPRSLVNFITDPFFGFKGARNAQAFNQGMWFTLNSAAKGTYKVLSDELYRRVLKARIIKNGTRNTRRDLIDVLKTLSGFSPKIKYLGHGLIELDINEVNDPDGLVSYFVSRYLFEDSIIPRQLGYRITVKSTV